MNGKNNPSYSYKEINNLITNQTLDTNLQRCQIKAKNENIADIVADSLKLDEASSNNEYLRERNILSVSNKNEEKIFVHPLNLEQSTDFNYNSVLKMENLNDESKTELHLENVSSKKIDLHRNAKVKQTDIGQSNSISGRNMRESNSSSYLPDILSSLNKSESDDSPTSDSESISRSRSYLPNPLRSQTQLHSLQSIYKFAYDENVTDQSDTGSKSPSPLDPESNVPSSLTSTEILIHEAESGSDAGSEDVELIPHRYESETFLSDSKHVYVNKLSLAVELLRTQETLPYDDEFKRVTNDNRVPHHLRAGEKAFSSAFTSQSQVKQTLKGFSMQEDTETESRENRKFGVHQYISHKRAVSMDPWICCIIM